jgi:hypothetical protein
MDLTGFDPQNGNWGVSTLRGGAQVQPQTSRVRTCRLEPSLDKIAVGRVDLLKMDIEGAEELVLPTMQEGVHNHRYRRVLLELHPQAFEGREETAAALLQPFLTAGYRAWRIDHLRAAFRRAAYRLPRGPDEFLLPLKQGDVLGSWPHILLLAPGVDGWDA